jgi:hypothetical protein
MTLPIRGIWKNSVLHNVLHENQIRQKIKTDKQYHIPLPVIEPTTLHTIEAAGIKTKMPGDAGPNIKL